MSKRTGSWYYLPRTVFVVIAIYWVDLAIDPYIAIYRFGAQFANVAGLTFGTFVLALSGAGVISAVSGFQIRRAAGYGAFVVLALVLAGKHVGYAYGSKAGINIEQEWDRYYGAFRDEIRSKQYRGPYFTDTRSNVDAFLRNGIRVLQHTVAATNYAVLFVTLNRLHEAERTSMGRWAEEIGARAVELFSIDKAKRKEIGPGLPMTI